MPKQPFPIWATIVPVVGALVLWVITQSPLVLAFAALGPIGMLAQRMDRSRAERARLRFELPQAQSGDTSDDQEAARQETLRRNAWEQVYRLEDMLAGRAPHGRNQAHDVILGSAEGYPVTLSAELSVGIVGPELCTSGIARSVHVQHAHAGSTALVTQARTLPELGPCEAVVTVHELHLASIRHGPGAALEFEPHYLATATASDWLSQHAPSRADRVGPLSVELGRSDTGVPHRLNLASGPHALVAGTTGSGKTELLRTWITEMADANSPTELSIVCIDFKGGTGLRDLLVLPHVVDVLTDLDAAGVDRVLFALRTELTRRERVLANHNARSLDELPRGVLPRLGIFVDEFQLLVERTRDATDVMSDVAARGRALGVHLVLATQHPSRAVRDHLAANCGIRVSLRLIDPTESFAFLGNTRATELSAPGAAISVDEHGPSHWRVNEVGVERMREIANRWRGHTSAESPWLPALAPGPEFCLLADRIAADSLAICDRVDERQYHPVFTTDVRLLRVSGAAQSGRTTTLSRIAELSLARSEQVWWCSDADAPAAWTLLSHIVETRTVGTLLIDNLDDLLLRFEPEYRLAFQEMFRQVSKYSTLSIAASSRGSTSLDDLFPDALALRTPGVATWRGLHSVVVPGRWTPPSPTQSAAWAPSPVSLVVSDAHRQWEVLANRFGWDVIAVPRCAADFTEMLAPHPTRPRLIVGAAEHWLLVRSQLGQVALEVGMLFADGHPADVRALRRQRTLPPPMHPGEAWWAIGAAPLVRVRLPLSDGRNHSSSDAIPSHEPR